MADRPAALWSAVVIFAGVAAGSNGLVAAAATEGSVAAAGSVLGTAPGVGSDAVGASGAATGVAGQLISPKCSVTVRLSYKMQLELEQLPR